MSEMSKVVSDRDRARLQFKEYVIELAAARGQEDDIIDKIIAKINKAFDVLVSSHVELVLSLGESLSDETHENFMYEASDERDEAVEGAEKGKIETKKIAREEIVTEEDLGVNNLELSGKKDRKEFFDRKLMISCKVSPEVARMGLSQMFSAGTILRAFFPIAILHGEFGPQEASRMVKHVEQLVGSFRQVKNFIKVPGPAHVRDKLNTLLKHTDVELRLEQQFGRLQHVEELAKSKLSGGTFFKRCFGSIIHNAKVNKKGIKMVRERAVVHTLSSDEFHGPGEKMFGNMPHSKGLTRFNITINDREPARFKLSGPVWVKRRSGSIRLNSKTAMAGQLGYDNGKPGQYDVGGIKYIPQQERDTFDVEQQFGVLQQARVRAKFESPGLTYVKKSVEDFSFGITYNPGEKLFVDVAQFKGFTRLNIPFNHVNNKLKLERKLVNGIIPSSFVKIYDTVGKLFDHMDNELKLEQKLSSLQQAGDLPEFKLGTACAKRYSGSTVLVVKSEFIKKGVGGCNLFKQYVCAVRSYEDFGPLAKYSRLKVSGAVCLEEKHRAFIREELNILLKHSDNKLKLERQSSNFQQARVIAKLKFTGTTHVERFIGGFELIAKPAQTSKVGRLKDIDPRIQQKEGERA